MPPLGPDLVWDDTLGLRDRRRRMLFSAAAHAWTPDGAEPSGTAVDAIAAVGHVLRSGGGRRLPVGVIGPNEASAQSLASAETSCRQIAGLGLPVVCGGRGGCMEAAARGAAEAGGLVIGILPSQEWLTANPHVHIPIATGLGEARNAIIASACFALIAVGAGYGTLSEMALGLKLGRLVIAMPEAEQVPGAQSCSSPETAITMVAWRYLGLPPEALS